MIAAGRPEMAHPHLFDKRTVKKLFALCRRRTFPDEVQFHTGVRLSAIVGHGLMKHAPIFFDSGLFTLHGSGHERMGMIGSWRPVARQLNRT